jgi:hypothetical protein
VSKNKIRIGVPKPPNNPYLVLHEGKAPDKPNFSLWSEVKRLLGGFRSPFTLIFLVIPLALGLSGGADLLSDKLYELAKRGQPDPRARVVLVQCWFLNKGTMAANIENDMQADNEKCRDVSSPLGLKGDRKFQLWPFELETVAKADGETSQKSVPTEIIVGLLTLAFTAYLTIGNPRVGSILIVLQMAFGGQNKARSGVTNGEELQQSWALQIAQNGAETASSILELQVVKTETLPVPVIEISTAGNGLTANQKGKLTKLERAKIKELEAQKTTDAILRNCLILGGYRQRQWSSNPGYFYLDYEVEPLPYWLTTSMLKTNLLIVAPPGSGKTLSVFQPLVNFVRRAEAAGLFFDVKGDDFRAELFDHNFSLTEPATSIRINLYSGKTPEQAGERLAEALISAGEGGVQEYFANNAKDALSLLVAAHVALFEHYPTPNQLIEYLTSTSNLNFLQNRVEAELPGEYGRRLSAILRRVTSLNAPSKNDVLGMLANALIPLTTPPASDLLVANPDNESNTKPTDKVPSVVFTVEELLKKPSLTRIALPVAEYPRLSEIIGKLILAQFSYAVLSPNCNRELFKLAAVDETRYFMTPTVANGMAQARSNNAGYALSFQTLSQIKDEELRDTVFAASGTKIVMAGVGDKDAERFSKTFGGLELQYANRVQSSGTTQGKNSSTSTSRGQETEGFGLVGGVFDGSHSSRESKRTATKSRGNSTSENHSWSTSFPQRLRPRFLPSEVRELPRYHAIIETSDYTGQRWFAQVIDMTQATVTELGEGVRRALIHELQK